MVSRAPLANDNLPADGFNHGQAMRLIQNLRLYLEAVRKADGFIMGPEGMDRAFEDVVFWEAECCKALGLDPATVMGCDIPDPL